MVSAPGMAKALGTSFVATQVGATQYVVPLSRFGVPHASSGREAISLVLGALEGAVRDAELGEVSFTKVFTNQAHSECGLLVDISPTQGAAITALSDKLLAREVRLTVARSSKVLRGAMWGLLALCCLGGLALMKVVSPPWDPALMLAVGLLGGCAAAVAAGIPLMRSQRLAGGRSAEVTERLDEIVRAWLDADLDAPAPKKRRKKRKAKQTAADTQDPDAAR